MSGCDVLALFAHPDDESMLAGGTLAACSAANLRVGIVSLTRGELGAHGATVVPARLASLREHELTLAGETLGAVWTRCLSFPDGELASIDRKQLLEAVAGVLADAEPSTLITFAADGLYWHPDHIAVHELAQATADRQTIYQFTWPAGLLARAVAELRRRGLPTDMWGIEPEAFGAEQHTVLQQLDVTPWLEVKLRALRCHHSQLTTGHALAELPPDVARQLLGYEWIAGPDGIEWLNEVLADGCGKARR